jgi:hypothetical protein
MTNSSLSIFPLTLIRAGGLPLHVWETMTHDLPDWATLQQKEEAAAEQLLYSLEQALAVLPDSPLRTVVYNARKAFFQRRKTPAAALETQLLTAKIQPQLLEAIASWREIEVAKLAAEQRFEQLLEANYRTLQTIVQDETLRRALLFASHDLLASLPNFAAKNLAFLDKRDRQTAFSTLKYLTRALFKTSPLGRFTSVQVKSLRESFEAAEQIDAWLQSKSMVTPNVAILPAIYEVLLREPAFFQSLEVSLNPCLSDSNRQTWLYFDGEQEAFQQINPDPVVDFVIDTLLLEPPRKLPFLKLLQYLEAAVEATATELQGLIFKLIDTGLLAWELPERGLSPGWCGGLYQYLGYLPASPVLSEAAYLLQWLRTTARTLSFQPVEEAQKIQVESLVAIKTFLENHGAVLPPIPPEQVFFEDFAQDITFEMPSGTIETLLTQLAEHWQENARQVWPPFRLRLFHFAQKTIPAGQSMDFLEFSRLFLESSEGEMEAGNSFQALASNPGKLGALLQIFVENGKHKAVVNAMYPGGGKMFARWISLFPANVSESLKTWQNTQGARTVAFPWQSWSNANFQPVLSGDTLRVPDARTGAMPGGQIIALGELGVRLEENGSPQLIDNQYGTPIIFNDLGLESPESRPPVMQVLWHLGMPWVSSEMLLPKDMTPTLESGVWHRRRVETASLVLAREAWELPAEVCERLFATGKTQAARIGLGIAFLQSLGVPRYFFGRVLGKREKPQFYDQKSPISMLLLEKNLQKSQGNLLLTEMLPTPYQCLGDRVGEFVLEFDGIV